MSDDITVPIEPTDAMIDAGLLVTKTRLSLPGSKMTQNRMKMRLRYMAMCAAAPPLKVDVSVPGAEFRMGQDASAVWDDMGLMIAATRAKLGDDMAFSVLMSRLTREIRRRFGIEATLEILYQMAKTMPEASQNDR